MSTISELNGGGARAYTDGMNSGGTLSCHDVEWAEGNFPILYVLRRHISDGAGPGKFRGGAGVEVAVTIHDAPTGTIRWVASGVVGLKNSGKGLFGGYPGAPSVVMLLQNTAIRELLAKNQLPGNLDEVGGQARLLPYCEFEFKKGDVIFLRKASGGGFGDPLERDPWLVVNDTANELISKEAARDVYGVVMDGSALTVDLEATENRRAVLRDQRL